jgi:hypothetical protein
MIIVSINIYTDTGRLGLVDQKEKAARKTLPQWRSTESPEAVAAN